jgi:hypothetical protein
MLPPNLGVISSFFNKEVVSTSPNLFLEYENLFILDRGIIKIFVIYSSVEINWRTTSLLDFITENIMLDLKGTLVCHGTLVFSKGFI